MIYALPAGGGEGAGEALAIALDIDITAEPGRAAATLAFSTTREGERG